MSVYLVSDYWFHVPASVDQININVGAAPGLSSFSRGVFIVPKTPTERHHALVPLFGDYLKRRGYTVKEIEP